jgi:hypothetical protein
MIVRMNGADAGVRGIALTPKVIAEVEELHGRSEEIERETGGRGRRARHELRVAREAESDLLRVLGFESYGQFATVVAAAASAPSTPAPQVAADAPVAESRAEDLARDAEQTEAGLLNVLRTLHAVDDQPGEIVEVPPAPVAVSDPDAPVAVDTPDDDRVEVVVEAAAVALLQATQELRALGELLRDERAEITALGARSRAVADEILAEARRDAQRIRDEAAAEARELDDARAAAMALTRNAIVTVDGLRRLAAEDERAEADADDDR